MSGKKNKPELEAPKSSATYKADGLPPQHSSTAGPSGSPSAPLPTAPFRSFLRSGAGSTSAGTSNSAPRAIIARTTRTSIRATSGTSLSPLSYGVAEVAALPELAQPEIMRTEDTSAEARDYSGDLPSAPLTLAPPLVPRTSSFHSHTTSSSSVRAQRAELALQQATDREKEREREQGMMRREILGMHLREQNKEATLVSSEIDSLQANIDKQRLLMPSSPSNSPTLVVGDDELRQSRAVSLGVTPRQRAKENAGTSIVNQHRIDSETFDQPTSVLEETGRFDFCGKLLLVQRKVVRQTGENPAPARAPSVDLDTDGRLATLATCRI
jgi:hypothetical protein